MLHEISYWRRWYLKSAYNGNKIAQNNLGIYYYYDKGTYKNEKKAFERYMKSAIAGYAEGQSQNNLGACYQQLYKNEIKAFEWYMKLDVLKDNIMQKIEMHKYDKTETKAFEWYMKSAIAGCAEGQCNLGCCYGNG
ncbi:Sel1 repeat family protein [Rhizophagus irregularis DAOM 181602=DAOM 197198]|nr:Sel1 repeat family protein [Rhizophagus irregularis DAOM 181602=DAOM 197198]